MWNSENINENGNGNTTMAINGSVFDLTPGDDLREVVLQFARDAGFGKFHFYIDEVEVLPQDAPMKIEEGRKYKIVPYDQAG